MLGRLWIKCTKQIFKSKTLKAKLDEKILFGKITLRLVPEVRKMLARDSYRNGDSTLNFGL